MKAALLLLVAALMLEPVKSAIPLGFDANLLSEIRALKALPDGVRAAFGLRGVANGGIADRNEPFNVADVVSGPTLPMRRFIVGGVSDSAVLVSYERGGRGYSIEARAFSRANAGWAEIGHWHLSERPQNLRNPIELIDAASK
jgi:hypothetical protein